MTYIGIKCHISTIYRKLLYKLVYGKRFEYSKFTCRSNFLVNIDADASVRIGSGCFFNNSCSLNCMKRIEIGDCTVIGENVKFYDHNYHISDKSTPIVSQGHSTEKIIIGKNCWIGSNVVILKGVTIGDNTIIGAGCVIDKSIPANTIVKMNRDYTLIDRRYK